MTSTPFIRDGTYSIKSASNNTYLTRDSTNSVVAQSRLPNNDASQLWTFSRGSDGDYEIKSSAGAREPWQVNGAQLVCSASGHSRVTWNIEPRGSDVYVIGNAANADAIQLSNRGGPVAVVPRTNANGARQRWILEPDLLSPQSILNSLDGVWRMTWTWVGFSQGEGMLVLQASNGAAQGSALDTWGRRYTCVVRHISGNRIHFDWNLIYGMAVGSLAYEGTISPDRLTLTGAHGIVYTRIPEAVDAKLGPGMDFQTR